MLFIRRGPADSLPVAFCATNVSGSYGDTPKSRSEGADGTIVCVLGGDSIGSLVEWIER